MKNGTKILAGLGGLAALWGVSGYVVVRKAYDRVFSRSALLKYSTEMTFAEYEKLYPGKYTRRSVQFPSGGLMLQGYLYGEDRGKGLIVCSHGVFAGHESYIGGILNLVDRGYLVFGFDNTGSCESPGDSGKGLQQGPLDLSAALDYVESQPELAELPRFLFGHSWGGYSVCAVLKLGHKVDGVISISGFSEPVQVTAEMGDSQFGPISRLAYPMIGLENRRRFGENAGLSAIDGINGCDTPILIMHGAGDHYVRVDGAGIINHQDEITNPNVTFRFLDYPGRNGHNDIFLSEEAKIRRQELLDRLEEPVKEHHVKNYWDLPDEVQEEYFRDFDKSVTSQVNTELFDDIDRYLMGLLQNMKQKDDRPE